MTSRLNRSQRDYLRTLVLDCTLRRFSTQEALKYIKDKLHVSITDRYYFVVKKNIVDKSGETLAYLQKNRNAFLAQFFERIHEQYKLQRELYEMYYTAKEDKDKKLQLECIRELKEVSLSLAELYNYLPNIAGIHFESDNTSQVNVLPPEKVYKYSSDSQYDPNNPAEWAVGLNDDAEYSGEAKF